MKSLNLFTFRGYHPFAGNDRWIEGWLSQEPDGQAIITNDNGIRYYVPAESVGIWSGYSDKNGARIFSGDVIEYLADDGLKYLCLCKYGEAIRAMDTGWEVQIKGFYFERLDDGKKTFPIVKNAMGMNGLETFEVVGQEYIVKKRNLTLKPRR